MVNVKVTVYGNTYDELSKAIALKFSRLMTGETYTVESSGFFDIEENDERLNGKAFKAEYDVNLKITTPKTT